MQLSLARNSRIVECTKYLGLHCTLRSTIVFTQVSAETQGRSSTLEDSMLLRHQQINWDNRTVQYNRKYFVLRRAIAIDRTCRGPGGTDKDIFSCV